MRWQHAVNLDGIVTDCTTKRGQSIIHGSSKKKIYCLKLSSFPHIFLRIVFKWPMPVWLSIVMLTRCWLSTECIFQYLQYDKLCFKVSLNLSYFSSGMPLSCLVLFALPRNVSTLENLHEVAACDFIIVMYNLWRLLHHHHWCIIYDSYYITKYNLRQLPNNLPLCMWYYMYRITVILPYIACTVDVYITNVNNDNK